jgi:hypothetical protein
MRPKRSFAGALISQSVKPFHQFKPAPRPTPGARLGTAG